MKISLNWLKDYIDFDLSPEKLAAILTDTGLEVDGFEQIEAVRGGLKNVVVGAVLTCEKHPDADRLKVTTVSLGEGDPLQIVCGAPNVAVGQKVLVAKIGAELFPSSGEHFTIKKSKIRGVESCGMICAEDELGIGESHAGILILDKHAKVGTPAAEYLNLPEDYLIEIGLTPNRADAMGHIGVARDLKAYLNVHEGKQLNIHLPDISNFKHDNNSLPIAIEVENTENCLRYCGITLSDVVVKPSPDWLQNRLRTIGLSPINNIVDSTNYVMHELGTPLHAFDARVVGKKITIRSAKKGETLVTLDGIERKLSSQNLVIANDEKALCIAGVFGGKDSGVSEQTQAIFLEAAYFSPSSVRKTAKLHGLNTDASFRFERGIDINNVEFALKRTALLIKELAGGAISMPFADIYPQQKMPFTVPFRPENCRKLIGASISDNEMKCILRELEIQITEEKDGIWKLAVPNYRVDVTREVDVIEDILRIYGFNRVDIPEKLNAPVIAPPLFDKEKVKNTCAEQLIAIGYSEMLNNSITTSSYIEKWNTSSLKKENTIRLLNPLSNELDVMRQSMLLQALETIAYNQNRQQADLKLFEYGKTYQKEGRQINEREHLLLTITGLQQEENWNKPSQAVSFYTLKGHLNGLFTKLGIANTIIEKQLENSLLEEGVSLFFAQQKIGELGWISADMKKQFSIKNDVFVADLEWDALLGIVAAKKATKYVELPKTQSVRRDFSLLLNPEVSFGQLQELAFSVDKRLLKKVNLFDVYQGKNIENNKKSYALSFIFQDAVNTLKDEQVDAIMNKIRKEYTEKLHAELRQ